MKFDYLLSTGQLKKEITSRQKLAEFLIFAENELSILLRRSVYYFNMTKDIEHKKQESIAINLCNKRILVTGGAGFLG